MPFPSPNGRYLAISGGEGVIHSGLRKNYSFCVWRGEVREITSPALKRDPGNAQSRELYNYSVARVVSLLQGTWKLQDARAVTIGTGSSAYHLTFSSDIKLFDNPRECHFIPADERALSGKDYTERVCRDGGGAPVLAETDNPVERAREQFLISGRIYYGMTAVLQFHGSEARLRLRDPLLVRST
jgi:hypothetical protein